jgi:hypothetical protein
MLQMKRKTLIRILFIIAILSAILLIFKSRSPFGKNNVSFASEPKDEITRIIFSDGNKEISLEKEGERWLLNGEKETRKSGVLFILRVLKEMQIKSPVSPELFSKEVSEKDLSPVNVKVYEKRKLLNSFLVFKTQSNIYGNIMKKKERAKPFIVYVPGFDGDIGSGFTMNELFWQPYTIFDYLPSEIAAIDFENPADTSNSFSIRNNKKNFLLVGKNTDPNGSDSIKVSRYISYFTRVPFESWALNMSDSEKRETEAKRPLYRISVTPVKGDKTVLTLWEKTSGKADSLKTDSDRLYGKTDKSSEIFIVRYFDVDPILKKRSYFYITK